MEKTIYIDEKPVKLKSGAGLPKRYKAQFRRDYFADLMKISKSMGSTKKGKDFLTDLSYEDLEHLDMEVIYDIVWAMAKSADRNIPEPQEWLDGFETFPIKEIMTEIKDLISGTIQGTKKLNDEDSSSGEVFTVESFSYVCKQVGLTSEEMEEMTIGDCLDFIQEYVDSQKKQNGKKSNVRKATQDDMDLF